MPNDIKVPIIGKMPRGAALAGGFAVVAVSGYLIYKHFTKTTTTPTSATGYGYGYGTGTGSPYGYGYGYGTSPYGTYGFGGGGSYPNPYGYGYGSQQPPITTNAQWGQAAEAAMGSTGTDQIAAAIAKYLAAGTLTPDQELIVQEAMAVVGNPPQEGLGGYPPKMHVAKGGGGGGGNATNPVTGLHVSQPGTTGVDIAWNASAGATSYQVTSTHGNVQMLGATSARIRSINAPGHSGASATVQLLAEPAANGATPASIQVKTRGGRGR
jgi:hypothetical protein